MTQPTHYIGVARINRCYLCTEVQDDKMLFLKDLGISPIKALALQSAKIYADTQKLPFESTILLTDEHYFTVVERGAELLPAKVTSTICSIIQERPPKGASPLEWAETIAQERAIQEHRPYIKFMGILFDVDSI